MIFISNVQIPTLVGSKLIVDLNSNGYDCSAQRTQKKFNGFWQADMVEFLIDERKLSMMKLDYIWSHLSTAFNSKKLFNASQALHGLAPKCELINMHELIKKSTNNYVTLLPLENGINLNTKG